MSERASRFFGAISQGLQQFTQHRAQQEYAELEERRVEARMRLQSQLQGENSEAAFGRQKELVEMEHGLGLERDKAQAELRAQSPTGGSQLPASLIEYAAFQKMTPEEREQFLLIKRGQPGITLETIQRSDGTSEVFFRDPSSGQLFNLSGAPATPQIRPSVTGAQPVGAQPSDPAAGAMMAEGAGSGPAAAPVDPELGRIRSPEEEAAARVAAEERAKTQAIPERARVESQAEDFARAPVRLAAARDVVHTVEDQLGEVFDRVMQNANVWTVGFGSIVKPPGSPAADMAADLQTLGANAAFDRLQQMRDSSPTGGALGQVSERELALLQSAVAAIEQSQSPDQFRENIERLRRHYDRIGEFAKDAMKMDEIKARIVALERRPPSPPVQAQIDRLYDRLYEDEDKIWSRFDSLDSDDVRIGELLPDGGSDQGEPDNDPLSVLTPELRAKYGL